MKLLKQLHLPFILLLLCMCACSQAKSKLETAIENEQKKMPVNMGLCGYADSVNYNRDSNTVTISVVLNPGSMSIEMLDKADSLIGESLLSYLRSPASKQFTKLMVDAEASYVAIYREAGNNKELKVSLSPDQIKEAYEKSTESSSESAEQQLKNSAAITTSACPMKIEEGMMLTAMVVEPDALVYRYSMDENLYDLSAVGNNSREIKEEMRKTFSDPSVKLLIKLCRQTNRSLIYSYTGNDSGKTVTIEFKTSEL